MAQGGSLCRIWITRFIISLERKKQTFMIQRSTAGVCPEETFMRLLKCRRSGYFVRLHALVWRYFTMVAHIGTRPSMDTYKEQIYSL